MNALRSIVKTKESGWFTVVKGGVEGKKGPVGERGEKGEKGDKG